MVSPTQRRALVEAAFCRRYDRAPSLWCRAPGRVDLMGSHTDYDLGFVLTLAIGYDTWIAAAPRQDRTVRLHSMNLDAEISNYAFSQTCAGERRFARSEQP